MTQKKFIQLLNLYIDGEATPVEVCEVEHAIENDASRRRMYHEYRKIQDATRVLYGQFRREDGELHEEAGTAGRIRAAGVRSAAALPGHVSGSPFRRVLFWAGGAAAACLALAFAFWSIPRLGGPQHQVDTADSSGVSVPVREPSATDVATNGTTSFAAPFATQMRIDPYLASTNMSVGDPFSLAPGQPQGPADAVGSLLGPGTVFEPARFAPTAGPIDPAQVAEENRRLKALLRGEFAPRDPAQPESGMFVPVNLRQQP